MTVSTHVGYSASVRSILELPPGRTVQQRFSEAPYWYSSIGSSTLVRGAPPDVYVKMSNHQRRAFYRLQYPEAEQPFLEASGHSYRVFEVSEGGMRVRLKAGLVIGAAGHPIEGVVYFADGSSTEVSGVVQRSQPHEAVLILSRGISFRQMMAEQARLSRTYPALFDPLQDMKGDKP